MFLSPSNEECSKTVRKITRYNNLNELLEEIDTEEIMPGADYEEVRKFWREKTNPQNEEKYGIVVFEI